MTEIEAEDPMHVSWHDSAWIPHLNPTNVLDYFCERSNPFYDGTCNNEIVKMQRLNPEQLLTMTGLEYTLLHSQEPILYVIRKQIRQSNTQVSPQADYYILAGVVYQAPDLKSVIQSRILTCVHNLQSAFNEFQDIKKFHPSTGFNWSFNEKVAKKLSQQASSRLGDEHDAPDLDKDSAALRKQGLEEPYTKFHEMKVDPLLRMLDDAVKISNKAPVANDDVTGSASTSASLASTVDSSASTSFEKPADVAPDEPPPENEES